jgi:hypothetical protein
MNPGAVFILGEFSPERGCKNLMWLSVGNMLVNLDNVAYLTADDDGIRVAFVGGKEIKIACEGEYDYAASLERFENRVLANVLPGTSVVVFPFVERDPLDIPY